MALDRSALQHKRWHTLQSLSSEGLKRRLSFHENV